jgi:hypothetical protein
MLLHVHVQPQHVTLQYQISNVGREPLFVLNQIFDWYNILQSEAHAPMENHNASPTSALAYVASVVPNEVLIYVMDVPLPMGISAFAPRVALATRLAPNETTTATLRLPLPLDEWNSYMSPKPSPTTLVHASVVRMRVSAVTESAISYAREHPSFRGMWQVTGHPHEIHEATATLNAALQVRRRTDSIDRPR